MGGCVRHRINRWLGGKIAAGWEGCEMGWGVGGVDYIDGGVIGGMVVDVGCCVMVDDLDARYQFD